MQAASRKCCRPSPHTVYQRPWRPSVTRSFRTSTTSWNEQQPESSRQAPPFSDEAYSTIQIDHENKTVATAVGELPISPLMDPSFHEARQRFTKPKPIHSRFKSTKFQRQLARNPYARALATPVRRCPVSAANLPSFFLQRFTLVPHPETGTLWFMPRDLEKKGLDTAKNVKSGAQEASPVELESAEQEPEDKRAEPIQAGSDALKLSPEAPETLRTAEETAQILKTAWETGQTGPSAFVLSRQRLLQELQRPDSLYFNSHKRLLRMSVRGQSRLTDLLHEANWRSDMDVAVRELMRRRVVEGLRHFAKLVEEEERAYIIKCEGWNDVKSLKHRGCLLYLGLPDGTSPESRPEYVPPRLSMMDMGSVRFGSKLAVHNLCELLGEQHVNRLRQEFTLLHDGSLYLLGRQATVNLQMLMWKLQGYMEWEEPKEAYWENQAPKSHKGVDTRDRTSSPAPTKQVAAPPP